MGRVRRATGWPQHHLGRDAQAGAAHPQRGEGALPLLRHGGGHRLPPPRFPGAQRVAGRGERLRGHAPPRSHPRARGRELRHLLRGDHGLLRHDLQASPRREGRLARRVAGRAAVTSLFFTIGKFLIGLYLGRSAVASAYGAAGSLVVIVVWVYYSAQILLFGAEFTKVWTKRRGSGFTVEKTAKAVTAEARAEQGLGPKQKA